MTSNINHTPLRTWASIESYWRSGNIYGFTTPNYPKLEAQIHYNDGWREYIRPVAGVDFNPETERLGELYHDLVNDVVTNQIDVIPEEELRQIELSNIRSQRSEAIRIEAERQQELAIMEPIHALTDIEQILQNEEKIPLWYDFDLGYEFEMPFKIRAYRKGVMTIFDLRIAHSKESFEPETTPALWNAYVIGGDGVEVWEQQLGNTGKYPLIDPTTNEPYRVSHKNETWQNRRALNTSEPGTPSSGWMQVSNLPAPWYSLGNEGYPLDWEVTHVGKLWRSNMAGNFWEPGVAMWTDLGVV